jgi:hypothetical protein
MKFAFNSVGQEGSGCQVHGDVDLTTVNGNFHFAPGTGTAHHGAGTAMTLQELLTVGDGCLVVDGGEVDW